MTWLRVFACIVVVFTLLESSLAAICPDGCVCRNTRDGLHRATCSNLAELYKFTIRQKHHNINALDLSHNNITKIAYELDRLTELVTLDLSTNRISHINKFLPNAKKLVHLNLANNRLEKLSLAHLPTSVSSLDLTSNLLHDVPSDLGHLISLEHLELEGNPLNCSCDNLMARDRLLTANVFIDNVICALPAKIKGRSWLELKTKDICKVPKTEINYLDMMMGDQPIDALSVGLETTALKSKSLVAPSDLEEGSIIQEKHVDDDDDSLLYINVKLSTTPSPLINEGSGDGESTTVSDVLIEPKEDFTLNTHLLKSEEILPASISLKNEIEGSGEGSGYGTEDYEETVNNEETTTVIYEELNPGPVRKLINEDNTTTEEYPIPKPPTLYQGGADWLSRTEPPVSTGKPATPLLATRDTTVSDKLEVTPSSDTVRTVENKQTTHKTGTYVCIAIIVILLVGLIGFAIIKGQMRKRRDRRLLRQQKRDVEKASKEMVDMNKSLLGKPAGLDSPIERKANGKYELVPTHEPLQKKSDNGDVANGVVHNDNDKRTDSPRDSNQNKSSSKDNNLNDTVDIPQQETSFDSAPASPDSRKDSLSSEDLPIHYDETPHLNGNADSDISHPLLNGEPSDSDFLSPSREYVPVYSPDMGRVRIKMTETAKPKTPVLVTRSRSNAGDIIITPSMNANSRNTTT